WTISRRRTSSAIVPSSPSWASGSKFMWRVVRLCRTTLFPHSFNARGQADLLAVEGGTGSPAVASSAKWFGSRGDHTKKETRHVNHHHQETIPQLPQVRDGAGGPPPLPGGGQDGRAGQRRRHGGLPRLPSPLLHHRTPHSPGRHRLLPPLRRL